MNTPACGSRRVCPSAASTLADDSSSRSFERRPASLFLPLSFSFFLSFSLSCFLSSLFSLSLSPFLSLSLSSYPCNLLSSDSSRLSRATDVHPAIERRFQVDPARTGRTDAPYRRRGTVVRRAVRVRHSIANVAAGWHFGRPENRGHAPVDTGG